MKYWIFKIFLVSGHLKFTYALSTSKIKVIIYQSFKHTSIFKHNYTNQFQKYFWPTFSTLEFLKLCIQYTINSIFSTMIV
jgi:hypothetical protein